MLGHLQLIEDALDRAHRRLNPLYASLDDQAADDDLAARVRRLRDSQKAALEDWVQEYRGDLGIALTDVVGMDAFLADFDLYFAKLFDGLRHDSGDPLVWAEKAIAHYEKLGIDPRSKTLVFSDGLDLPKSLQLYRALSGRIHVSFGIGTNLTCDIPGVTPMNIVIKMTACNGIIKNCGSKV